MEAAERQTAPDSLFKVGRDPVRRTQVAELFPINSMRNAALLLARTPLVLSTDIDMLMGRELTETVQDPAK